MTDISREKILDLMWENRSTLVNADIHPKAIIAVDLYYAKLETAIKSGHMDADPWIPVSTPPELTNNASYGESKIVLVRGWGEKKKHYIYAFALYSDNAITKTWLEDGDEELWFTPIEWAYLEQPKPVEE